jgi:hypothetical protein
MDLSKLSTDDLLALRAGDLAKVSTDGLKMLRPQKDYKALQKVEKKDVTDDMNILQTGAAGLGKMLTDTGRGIKQLLNVGDQEELQKTIDSEGEASKDLMSTWGGNIGNIAGHVGLAVIPGGAVVRAGNLARAPGVVAAGRAMMAPGFTGRGAALGASMGAGQAGLQATESGDSRVQNMMFGAVGGGAVPVAGMGARAVRAGVQPLYEGGREQIVGNALRSAAGQNADDVIARMQAHVPTIPGSQPTAAEVAESGGISAMQRAASAVDPEAYTHQATQNNAARVDALRELAGTGGEREFHSAARDTAAQKLYQEAYDKGVDITRDPVTGHFLPKNVVSGVKGEITKLMQRPAVQDAVKEARRLALNEGVKISDPAGSIQGLDYVQRAISDQIKKLPAGSNEARILIDLKKRLVTTLDRLSPKYAEARTTFREMSRPINQMDIVQEISDKSVNRLTDNINRGAFAKSVSDDTAQRVTGMKSARIADILEPAQLNRLNAIQRELLGVDQAMNLGRGAGSDSIQKLAMTNLLERSGLPAGLADMWGINKLSRFAYGEADEAMKNRLSAILRNPQDAARVMQAARRDPQLAARLDALRRIAAPAAIALPSYSNSHQ